MQDPQNFNLLLSPQEALQWALTGTLRLLDLRAPVEFGKGHIPGSRNGPILDNAERHQVGMLYRNEGQERAVALGHQLVGPHKAERVARWALFLQGPGAVVTCWRGGLRSETGQAWLREAGVAVPRMAGGYKAFRALLLRALERPLQGYVITGSTGCGKTAFLRSLSLPEVVDLEGLAHHRGSAFGGMGEQPAQQTFENALGLALERNQSRVLLEDESRLVGRCVLPEPFFSSMRHLPRLVLEEDLSTRVENLLQEYVVEPLTKEEPGILQRKLERSLLNLRNRLGGAECQEILGELRLAFAQRELELHRSWIRRLLESYYDKSYAHSAGQAEAPILFRGNAAACRDFLELNPVR